MLKKSKFGWVVFAGSLCVVAASAALVGCNGGNSGGAFGTTTVFGPNSTFGSGTLRSYLVSKNNFPQELGIEISAAAIANRATLPPAPAGQAASETPAQLPAEALAQTPFLSAAMFYASAGHPPAGQQDLPHLHPAWFTIDDATRFQILPGEPRVDVVPPANEVPVGYIKPPDPVFAFIPTLGNIFFNPAEAGYNETPFTTALSEYRYFNGHISLIALGAPNTFIEGKGSLKRPMGVPAKYPRPGNYPTTYSIRFDASRNVHIFALGDFVARN